MKRYYVTKNRTTEGFREMHQQGCMLLPGEEERVFLGLSVSSNEALGVARNLFPDACPCACCLESAVTTTKPATDPAWTVDLA